MVEARGDAGSGAPLTPSQRDAMEDLRALASVRLLLTDGFAQGTAATCYDQRGEREIDLVPLIGDRPRLRWTFRGALERAASHHGRDWRDLVAAVNLHAEEDNCLDLSSATRKEVLACLDCAMAGLRSALS